MSFTYEPEFAHATAEDGTQIRMHWSPSRVPSPTLRTVEWHLRKVFTKLGSAPAGSCGAN